MLPETLKRAERPTESLGGEGADALGCLRVGVGLGCEDDLPAMPVELKGQIGILRKRVVGKGARFFKRLLPEDAERSGNHRDAAQEVLRPSVDFKGAGIFQILKLPEPSPRVSNPDVA